MSESSTAVVRSVVVAAGLDPLGEPTPADAGRRNDVWFVSTDVGEMVVRVLADDRRLASERRVLEIAGAAGVPVAGCRWTQTEPFPAMVQDRLPGVRLDEVEPTVEMLQDLARILRRVHSLPVAGGFGNLDAGLRGATEQLVSWFTERVVVEVEAATLAAVDADLAAAALRRLSAGERVLRQQRPGFVHGDVQPSNLLISDGRISGVLDWEAAKSGPPAFDFGWWDWWSSVFGTPWTTDELVDAYDPDRRIDRRELAEVRELVQVRIWTRELATATRRGDGGRLAAARRGLGPLV